jgi:hypothetical protein
MRRVLRLGLIGWMGWWIIACQTAPPPHASKELSWAEIQRLVRTCPVSLPMTFLKPPLGVGGNYSNPQQTLFTHIPEGGKLVFKAPRQRGYRGAWPTDMYPGPWPIDIELISKPGCPIVVYFVSGQPAWEGKADGVSGVDG